MTTPLLQVSGLTMKFGGLTAVSDVAFEVQRGSITSLIGPNGAGKTTVFNCLTGFYRPTAGEIMLRDGDKSLALHRIRGHRIAQQARVVRTFQNIRLFKGMSLLENLLVAQHNRLMAASAWSIAGLLGLRGYVDAQEEAIQRATDWLQRIGLLDKADEPAGSLPYGDQRRLEIARAMCVQPLLLCLDEPAAGLNPTESAQLSVLLEMIRGECNTTVLLIEHDMSVVMKVSDHVVVLEYGRRIAQGRPEAVRSDPAVIRAYLGVEEDQALEADVVGA